MSSPDKPSLDELAAGEFDEIDMHTMRQLAALYTTLDPVPERLVDRVQFGITLDALEAEVAELQRSGGLVGVRADETAQAHTITFTSASVTLMITVTETSADRARVDGWVSPGAGATVQLRAGEETHEESADEDGRFVFADIPRGMAQFVVRQPAGSALPTVITPSVEF
jgi:hypothetical protein